jgi:DNA-binding CsgD family transcriptional regulator
LAPHREHRPSHGRPESAPPSPQPGTDPAPPALDSTVGRTLWDMLLREPGTGVALVGTDGTILFVNRQCAEIFLGPGTEPAAVINKPLKSLFPEPWVAERLRIFDQMRASKRPVLLRSIWRGFQQVSTMRLIDASPEQPERVLVITRRVPTPDRPAALANNASIEVIESSLADFGELDVLTDRELEVLTLIGDGMSAKEIAAVLKVTAKTVENHRQAIGKKLEARKATELAAIARQAGLTLADANLRRL